MLKHYILSYLGEDRPGLVDELSAVIAYHDANWQESRMTRLAGKFTGIVRLSVPDNSAQALETDLDALQRPGLVISLTAVDQEESSGDQELLVKVVGSDRSGIVKELASTLNQLNANVVELQTNVAPAAWSGEPLFEALLRVSAPQDIDQDNLRQELERLSDDLMVEVSDQPQS